MDVVSELVHVGVELLSRLARSMRHTPTEFGRALFDSGAKLAGVTTDGRCRGAR